MRWVRLNGVAEVVVPTRARVGHASGCVKGTGGVRGGGGQEARAMQSGCKNLGSAKRRAGNGCCVLLGVDASTAGTAATRAAGENLGASARITGAARALARTRGVAGENAEVTA